jgi:RNA polymerase sigma factor (sigma-70 family)
MSPLSLRRYRAERLLRDEFEGLRSRVLASARGRLRAAGVTLDDCDLEACYAHAWQGLYTAVLEGQEIANPAGWLVLVTFRRAIDEHRASVGVGVESETQTASAAQRDLAAELDDRVRLRQLFEALRGRLDAREREVATLCYLQGLSRAEAATRMGVSQARMRKLMEGCGPSRPGVAGKVGALLHTIRDGDWCEQQGSLMRAFAYGILDPAGERHQLALMHSRQCPGCRSYVASLRGLAAVLPPAFAPFGLGARILAHAGAAGATRGGMAGSGATGTGLQAGRGVAGGASACGAAGVAGAGGATGGGLLIGAGPLGAKLAVGCLLALGVGAGCIALEGDRRAPSPAHAPHPPRRRSQAVSAAYTAREQALESAPQARELATSTAPLAPRSVLTPAARASHEFGPEQLTAPAVPRAQAASADAVGDHARSADVTSARSVPARSASTHARVHPSPGGAGSVELAASSGGSTTTASDAGDSSAAEREFAPG